MFAPVVQKLVQRGVSARIVSLCELRGFDTPVQAIRELGAGYHIVSRVKFAKSSTRVATARRHVHGVARRLIRFIAWHALVRMPRLRGRRRPSLVVMPNDAAYPYDRIVKRLSAQEVPFLLVQEGIRFELPASTVWKYGQGGAHAIAAWGEASARYFVEVGVQPARVHAIGNPRLDTLASAELDAPAAEIARKLQIESGAVLYVSNPIDHQGFCSEAEKHDLFEQFLIRSAVFFKRTGLRLIVKLHSAEDATAFEEIVARNGAVQHVLFPHDVALYPLFKCANAVVVLASTAGLEAILLDRPVGVLPLPHHGYAYDYVTGGGALALTPNADLDQQLEQLVSDPPELKASRRAYASDQVANFGNAGEKLADWIYMQAAG